jgi:hypothetical protein
VCHLEVLPEKTSMHATEITGRKQRRPHLSGPVPDQTHSVERRVAAGLLGGTREIPVLPSRA